MIPQTCHVIADFSYQFPHDFKKWKESSNSIICLSVKDEKDLLKHFDKYSKITPACKFYEPDINEYTSICLYGSPDIRKKLSHLPLALKNNKKHEEAI
jgi:hypothetical protein